MQSVLPHQAVVISCHPLNPLRNCTGNCSVPATAAWGFCHSPPTKSQMVYTQVEFEDYTMEWVLWACHVEGLEHRMCHAVDVVVVDPAMLRSAVSGGPSAA